MPSVNISGNGVQNLRALQDLLQGGRVDDNIRGRKLPDGSIQLYTKASGTSRFGMLSKLASHQSRALGREGIAQIFGQYAKETGTEVTSTVRRAIDPGFARDVKAGALSLLVTASKARSADAARSEMRGKGLADLGVPRSTLREEVGHALRAIKAGNDPKEVGSALGRHLGAALMKTAPDAATRDAFALSMGDAFKDELAGLVDEAGGDAGSTLLDSAFSSAAFGVARNRMEDGKLQVGDRIYRREKNLGEGGGGVVDCYVNVSDPKDRIAFKVTHEADPQEMLIEIRNHARAQGDGHPNVLDFKGAVCCENGRLGMAMELCPLGDMNDALKSLDDAAKRGDISADQSLTAKLTLLQDAMKGIAAIQDNGLEHRDFKPGNVFMAADGTARLADFGATDTVDDYRWKSQGPHSQHYASPEIATFDLKEQGVEVALRPMVKSEWNHIKSLENAAKQLSRADDHAPAHPDQHSGPPAAKAIIQPTSESLRANPMREGMKVLLCTQLPNLSTEDRGRLLDQHSSGLKFEVAAERLQEGKRDAYAAGMTGFKFIHEVPKFKFESDFYRQYDLDPKFKLIADPTRNAANVSGAASGREWLLGDLVNAMTTLDIGKRKGVAEALDHAVFNTSGIGTSETRDVIRAAIKDGMARKAAAEVGSVGEAPKASAQGGTPSLAASGAAPRPDSAPAASVSSLADQLRSDMDDALRSVML